MADRLVPGAPLTPRQAEVLRYIARHIVHWQRPPTRHEIRLHFGWASDNAAQEHVLSLAGKGAVALDGATRNGGHGERYLRVLRWPSDVPLALTGVVVDG